MSKRIITNTMRQKLRGDAKYELDPGFFAFIENELKILIQLRRRFIDANI